MRKGVIPFIFLWPIIVMVLMSVSLRSLKGTLLGWSDFGPVEEGIIGHRGLALVYGDSSRLFWMASERYPQEYMRYAKYYEERGEWSEFAAPGIPAVHDDLILSGIRRFQTTRRADFELWLQRSGKYIPLMRQILQEHGLPGELVCLAMVESGFDPEAVSGAQAIGFWQFMPKTARRYGLRVDDWIDERMDPEKSTVAAAGFLADLYDRYGSWDLAIAAYNAGDLLIQEVTSQSGSREFWELARTGSFSLETRYLVIKFYSAVTILRDLDGHGFIDVVLDAPLVFEHVDCPPGTRLAEVAGLMGISEYELSDLNPQLIRRETPPSLEAYPLCVPVGTGDRVRGYFTVRPIS